MIIGSNLLFFENLPSTNAHAAYLLKRENLKEGTIVYTNYQSAGKGYSGNRWESEDGKNLLISIILFPSFLKPSDQFLISMTLSLGICDFLSRFIPGCSVKWPNDIYINNDKIAGILIENAIIADNQLQELVLILIRKNLQAEPQTRSLSNNSLPKHMILQPLLFCWQKIWTRDTNK
jgi:BirA family biotin operon repressor/biotin-[acetyl-CoA-carboxylase] ligase